MMRTESAELQCVWYTNMHPPCGKKEHKHISVGKNKIDKTHLFYKLELVVPD